MVSITLSDAEEAALQTERLNSSESVEDVVHRIVLPIVNRALADQVTKFVDQFNKIPDNDTKTAVLVKVQAIADSAAADVQVKG